MPVSKCAEQQKTATPPFQTEVPEGRPVLLQTVLLNILFTLFCRWAIQEVRVDTDMFMAEILIIKKKKSKWVLTPIRKIQRADDSFL